MPDTTQETNQKIIERLRMAQPKLSKLPPEHQKGVYGAVFDKYLKPQYTRLKLSPQDLETAKGQWIDSISNGKPQPLPSNFAVDKTPPSTGKKVAASLEAAGAGVLGGVRNLSEFVSKFDKSDLSKDPIHKALSEVEHKAYDDALAIDPTIAERSAGGGHLLASQIAYEGGAALGGASRLARAAVGGGAAAVTSGATGALDVGLQTATNVAIDALFHGLSRVGAKGAKTLIGKFVASKNPVATEAVKQIETAGKRVSAASFGGKPVGDLSPAEFQEWHKQSQAAIAAEKVKADEAAKAVKDAAKAQEPSREEKILARAKEQLAQKNARKAAADASKAFQQKVTVYAKRTGKIPEGEHLEALKGSATVDSLLGEQEKKVAKTITQVQNEHEVKVLQEGAPQALEAVQALKDIAPKVKKVVAKAEPMFKSDVAGIMNAETPEAFAKAKKDAIVALHTDAVGRSKTIKTTAEGLKIAEEERKETARINAIPVPERLGGRKQLDRDRKAVEKAGRVGMDVAEAEVGEKSKTIGIKAEQQMANPEIGIIDALDAQKGLLATIEGMVGVDKLKRVKLAVQHDPIEVQNEKLQKFINLQPKVAAKQ